MRRPDGSDAHLSARVVLDYLEERLSAAGRRRVEEHLSGPCHHCRDYLLAIARLVETMRTDRVPEVPESMRARALQTFRRSPVRSAAVAKWGRVVLLYDSLAMPPPTTAHRSPGGARWLRFTLGENVLEMEAELEPGGSYTLRGRMSAPEPALYRIEVRASAERLDTSPDSSGRFAVERVPAGSVQITARGIDAHYRLPTFVL